MAKVATKFFDQDGMRAQKYHDTVVTLAGSNERGKFVTCFTGGWHTDTTKAHINDVAHGLGWSVYQEKGQWFASPHSNFDLRVPFVEGLTLFEDGSFIRP